MTATASYLGHTPPFSNERLLALFTKAPQAFWRHDVDVSLSAAVKMAQMAQIGGVTSTFYLDPRSGFYNVFSRAGQQAIRDIFDAGHDIGLHCDYRQGNVEAVVIADQALLENAVPYNPKVSFHMPTDAVLWTDFTAFENAYASEWRDRYISDSRGHAIKDSLVSNDMQISLHPEHWFR